MGHLGGFWGCLVYGCCAHSGVVPDHKKCVFVPTLARMHVLAGVGHSYGNHSVGGVYPDCHLSCTPT